MTRKRDDRVDPEIVERHDASGEIAPKLDDLDTRMQRLAGNLERIEKAISQMPNASDYRLMASEVARLQEELERMESKHKEGMLAMYAQIHKEIRSVRGDRVIEMIDIEPVTEEKLERASDQLSDLAKTWRKRRAQPPRER